MFNRQERRAVEQGKGFNVNRGSYQPEHVFTSIDGDLIDAWREYCNEAPDAALDDLWLDTFTPPDYPDNVLDHTF